MSVKAFDLLLVSRNLNISKIDCIEASGNDLYLGSDESSILRLTVEERTNASTDQVVYTSTLICHRNIGTKKSIRVLKAVSVLSRLLVLSDSNLYLLDSDVLTSIGFGPKLKNVVVFCINENPTSSDPFTLEFCVGKKKCFQLCSLHEDKVSVLKEISTQDPPINMAMDGKFVCVAGHIQYYIYNVDSGASQDIFPCNPSIAYPHIKRISKEEFLVVGPGNLGMFVTAAGTSERPPIQWSEGILSLTYYHPYILTLTGSFIRIYSLIDQQHKQTLLFSGAALMGNFDGQIYVATDASVHCLMPQPWTSQVMMLLENESVEEAIELTEQSGGAGLSGGKYLSLRQAVVQRAGFIRLAHGRYDEARHYFLRGKLDVRELISLYCGLLPSNIPFVRTHPPLHSIADINQAFDGDKTKIEGATLFLLDFLLHIRSYEEHVIHKLEIDTALLKLYCERSSEDLLLFLEGEDIVCALEECVQFLLKHRQYAALAKLYRNYGDIEKCLEVLTKLIRGQLKDTNFQGAHQLVEVILSSLDDKLIWSYSDFILEADECEGLRMFCDFKSYLEPSKVLKCLSRYPMSRIRYLNHIITVKNNKDEKYHTELIVHYIAEAEQQGGGNAADSTEERLKLQALLTTSTRYNPKTVLSKLQNTNFILEKATVYGRMNEHEKALSMLVHEMKDFLAAEQYCIQQTANLLEENKFLIYLNLLKIYLRPLPGAAPDAVELVAALNLLSLHSSDLNVVEVVQILPSEWSVRIANHYLKGALRASLHKSRMKKVQQNLWKSENVQQKFIFQNLCKEIGPIYLTPNSICSVCQRGFTKSDFSIYPNGVLTHRECVKNRNVCPLTGTVFKVRDTYKNIVA